MSRPGSFASRIRNAAPASDPMPPPMKYAFMTCLDCSSNFRGDIASEAAAEIALDQAQQRRHSRRRERLLRIDLRDCVGEAVFERGALVLQGRRQQSGCDG